MKTDPIEEAKNIFHTLERWTAFYEIEKQIGAIRDRWLTTGSKALKRHFAEQPSPGWKCADWGVERDTRWHPVDNGGSGEKGFSIGIGWREFELHLFHGGRDTATMARARDLLESPTFEPLRSLFGSTENRGEHRRYGSILSMPDFNPYDQVGESNLRSRIIAWHAAHETLDFVGRVADRIRRITEDPVIVGLIAELNRQAATDMPDGPPNP